jgi:hypothetical protein
MRQSIPITLYLIYFSAPAAGNNPCKTTEKTQCSDNIGDSCAPGGWDPGQVICCTEHGYVYCNDTDYMQEAECPNNGFCRTDFKTCVQQCHTNWIQSLDIRWRVLCCSWRFQTSSWLLKYRWSWDWSRKRELTTLFLGILSFLALVIYIGMTAVFGERALHDSGIYGHHYHQSL